MSWSWCLYLYGFAQFDCFVLFQIIISLAYSLRTCDVICEFPQKQSTFLFHWLNFSHKMLKLFVLNSSPPLTALKSTHKNCQIITDLQCSVLNFDFYFVQNNPSQFFQIICFIFIFSCLIFFALFLQVSNYILNDRRENIFTQY